MPFEQQPDKHAVRRAFERAAPGYDQHAELQRRVGLDLLDQLKQHAPNSCQRLLDVGSGTGYLLPELARAFPQAEVVALDFAVAMLRTGRLRYPQAQFVGGDAEALPLAAQQLDVIYSNLALQWCTDLGRALSEFRRVLRPGGVAAFSLFGPETLSELRSAWQQVDARPHVNDFITPDALNAALHQAGLTPLSVVLDPQRLVYPSVYALMRELKGLGAHNAAGGRSRHLTGKSALARMAAAYPNQPDGSIMASYSVVRVVAISS